jgi:molybdopterin-guanine dinucleotide biosynthesis protein A
MVDQTDEVPLGGVLVGGRSRRFGSDKALARVGDRSMADRAVRALRAACDPVVLLGGDGTLASRMALPWREDDPSGSGPLGGVASGLRWAGELGRSGLLVLACDLPLVSSALVGALADAARTDVDAVVPAVGSQTQPLCAWYAVGVLPTVEERLARGQRSMHGLLEHLRVQRLRWAPEGRAGEVELLNVNRPEDLEDARRHAMERTR